MIPSSLNFTPQSLHAQISHKAITKSSPPSATTHTVMQCFVSVLLMFLIIPFSSLFPSSPQPNSPFCSLKLFPSLHLCRCLKYILQYVLYHTIYCILRYIYCGVGVWVCVGGKRGLFLFFYYFFFFKEESRGLVHGCFDVVVCCLSFVLFFISFLPVLNDWAR